MDGRPTDPTLSQAGEAAQFTSAQQPENNITTEQQMEDVEEMTMEISEEDFLYS